MTHKIYFLRITVIFFVVCSIIGSLTVCTKTKEADGEMKKEQIIIARLDEAENYFDLHLAFEKAFMFLGQGNLAELPVGRHEINGDSLFCLISKGPGKTREEARLEAHRKYIDIQYIISGTDEMGWKPTADCTIQDEVYDAEKDIEFFKDEPASWNKVPAGSFIIFFPQDAHAPMVSDGEIHKAVLKIAVE